TRGVKLLTHLSRFAPLKVRQTGTRDHDTEARRGHGTETRTSWARVCLPHARACLRDSSCGGGHPSDHDVVAPQVGCADPVGSDLPVQIFEFVLRAPTCASMCSSSVRWVLCSQPRSY